MKKTVFFSVVIVIVVVFGFYIGFNRRNTVNIHPHTHSNERDASTDAVQSPDIKPVPSTVNKQDVIISNDSESSTVNTERVRVRPDVSEKQLDYDSQSDEVVSPKVERNDPPTDHIVQEGAEEQDTWIDDPEKMTADERHSVVYQQLLKQFGDIPEVHTLMDYNRKWDNNASMTLDEEIEGLTASMKIFPSESTRKTIAYYKWLRSKGIEDRSSGVSDISAEDTAHLQSQGISVKQSPANGKYKISISTK